MPKQKFVLERGGPKRLELDYSLGFKNLKVRVDGREVGVIQTKKEWEQGRSFKLADGSTLNVQLTKSGLSTGLTVLRDGWPVPGSNTDPYKRLSEAYSAAFFVAFVNLAIGLGGVLFQVDFLLELGLGWFSVIFGLVFVGLGFGIRAKSKLALGAALAILVLDSALTVYGMLLSGFGGTPYVSGLFIRVAILWMLWRGFDAISMLEAGPPSNRGMSSMLSGLPALSTPIASTGTSSSSIVEERKGGSWSSLEKGLVTVLGVLVLIVGGLIVSRVMPAAAVPPATAVLPTVQFLPTAQVIPATSIANDSPAELVLNISAVSPTSPMNIPASLSEAPVYAGDLAWNKPTFASSYYENGYPSGATNDPGAWRTASIDGTWFYVDLGEAQTIHQIVVVLFVDSAFTDAPVTQYIVSNDLKTWQVVLTDVNTENLSGRFQPRLLTLPEDVTARYVGLYAADWGGGWGGAEAFSVFSPENTYTAESLRETGQR